MSSVPQDPRPHKQPPGSNSSEIHFSPIMTAGQGPHATDPKHTTALPSPTPSGETRSPHVISSQPSPAGSQVLVTKSTATTHKAAEPSPEHQASSPKRPERAAETHPAKGAAGAQNTDAGRQTTASQARCKEWLAELESYISHREGSLQFPEKLRLQRLRAGLAVGDELCVVVHGFVVLWVFDSQRCAELLGLSRTVVDSACEILDIVFGGIRTMRNDVLAWLVNIPSGLRSGDSHSTSVMDVSRFFQRLASSWKDILRDHVQQRQIPLRHRELVGVLRLRSQNLRLTFFSWSLKFLRVYNTPENANFISILEKKFAEDRDFYLDKSRSEEEYESHDTKVAGAFEVLMSAAKRGPPEGVPSIGGSTGQAPAQFQQLRPPQQPQTQPQEQPRKRRRTQSLEENHHQLFDSIQEWRHQLLKQQQLQLPQHLHRLQLQHQHQQQQHHPYSPQQQGHPQPSPPPSQGLAESQRRSLSQQTLLQERAMQQMQQEQQNQILLRKQQEQGLHAQAHQQEQPRHLCPAHLGTSTPSPADSVFSPVQGQMRMGQAPGTPMPGYGWQPQIQEPIPVTASAGMGPAVYQGVPVLVQMPQHSRSVPWPVPNPVTPTMNSPASQHPFIEQQTRTVAPHPHIQSRPKSASPPVQPTLGQHQQGTYVNTGFVLNRQGTVTSQDADCGCAPTRNVPNPPSDQSRLNPELYCQYIELLLAGPTNLPANAKRIKLEFDVSESDFERLPKVTTREDGKSACCSIFEGSRSVRFRICTRPVPESAEDRALPENEWVDASTIWPGALSVKVNEDGFVDIPRKQGASPEIPCDIAAHLRTGRNVVSVVVASGAPPGTEFFGAVEMLNTETPSSIMDRALRQKSLPETEAIELIKSRLSGGDDDVQIVDPEIHISVADPISGTLVRVPCRGDTCRHLDVFDLETLLESRRPKRCPHGGRRTSCPTCLATPKAWPDVALADTWACPICSEDVRPGHLVVDKFLQGIVGKLAVEAGKREGFVPAVYVDGEGRWRANT